MKLLLIEDELSVVEFLSRGLKEQGFDVAVAMDGRMGADMLSRFRYDMVLLDIMLPEKNGMQILQEVRAQKDKTPIIVLTALGTTENIVSGLELGADDYLVKPFKFDELVARIHAVHRRLANVEQGSKGQMYVFEDIEVDDKAKLVTRSGEKITLTATEYKLLVYLIKNAHQVCSRQQILNSVWGIDFEMSTNIVDVYINYLRRKIEKKHLPAVIHTVFGMGYVMRLES